MIFLIQYDRTAAKLISMTSYDDGQREDASVAKLELEISLLGSESVNEVVLLQAPNEEHLRKTHRRYFETLKGLQGNEKR